ncbi:hypothetical protein CPLU01_13733 [Colletotrichum plurivorum]|uniref:Uncharacterized protein n=1 Tax=Colletotrichum plurivorum TaxID=2175906 RepID=A0A8H6JPQ5_9PEZI|nr:hypothetical protein CPLU01_13733 [Colletotrichum plurivorum]
MAGETVASSVSEPAAPSQRWYDKWRWYEQNTSKEEKTLLRKLDFMILTFGCLTFFTKDKVDAIGLAYYYEYNKSS